MGFQVKIDENTQRVLQRLRTSPVDVFKEPYAGYLLFLFGAADEHLLGWFSRHVAALDSLTGEHVAFAVFASRLPIKLHTHEKKQRARSIGEMELKVVPTEIEIERLVRSRRYGDVYDGDEIVAITYATDEMARAFGVVRDLPCMLVLDGLPRNQVQVIHLSDGTVDDLIPTLREVMHRLVTRPLLGHYLSLLKQLANLQKERANEIRRLAQMTEQAENVSARDEANERLSTIESLPQRLSQTDVSSVLRELALLSTTLGSAFAEVASVAKQEAPALEHCYKTLRNLKTYSERFPWPLVEPFRSRYEGSYRHHVRALIPDLPESPNSDSLAECQELISKLEHYRDRLVDKILTVMPCEADYLRLANEYRRSRLDALGAEIKTSRLNLAALDSSLVEAAKACMSKDYPSLSGLFTEVMTGKHLKAETHTIVDSAKAFAGQVFKPEMLLKIWGLVHGSGSTPAL